MKMKTYRWVLFAALCASSAAHANLIQTQAEMHDRDSQYDLNCEVSVTDSKSGEVRALFALHNELGTTYGMVDPPGDASNLLVEESSSAGIVMARESYAPTKKWFEIQKPKDTLHIKLYRRVGQVDPIGDGESMIPEIQSDTLLGELSILGTQTVQATMDTYQVKLDCRELPDHF